MSLFAHRLLLSETVGTLSATDGADTATITGSSTIEGHLDHTNLLIRSEEFDNSAWNAAGGLGTGTVTANATTASDGSTTADKLTNASADLCYLSQAVSGLTGATAYTFTVEVKDAGRSTIQLNGDAFSGALAANASFDLSGGTVSSVPAGTAAIVDLGGGWYRCSVSGLLHPTSTNTTPFIRCNDLGNGVAGVYL